MPPPQTNAIPLSRIIAAMRSALRSLSDTQEIGRGNLMMQTVAVLMNAGLQVNTNASQYRVELSEAYHQLLTLGYIVPFPQHYNAPNWDYLTLTETGREWAHSASSPIPEDVDGFIAAMNGLVPALDPVIKQYLLEAVVTYNRLAWFASAVMIGAASEKLIYMLLDALLLVSGGRERSAIEKAIRDRNLPIMFDQITKTLTLHIDSGALPYHIHEGCQTHLLSLFEAIRVQRNDAVHPRTGEVTPTTVRLTLSAFPYACRKMYDLMQWCEGGARPS